MYSFTQLQEIIEKELKEIRYPETPEELYQPVKYILSNGGKRIRPVLVLASCNIFSEDISPAVKPALGCEIFHNFTLMHDDIMDQSPVRRNMPTVHTKWNENTAILSGDAAMILAYKYIMQSPPETLPAVFEVFNTTALQVCEGQQLDMNFETRRNVTIEEYLEMIALKTSVLLAACLKIGAITGRAGEEEAELFYGFGKNMGIAFQLQDDLLDVYSDESKFGKKTGNDIVTNKKTWLLIKSLELMDGNGHQQLFTLLENNKTAPEEKIKHVTAIYDSLDIKTLATEEITGYFRKAMQFLDKVNIPPERKEILAGFAEKIIKREN